MLAAVRGAVDTLKDRLQTNQQQGKQTFPYLLSGDGKNVIVPLRPNLMANIVAIAESANIASVLVTEVYENSQELQSTIDKLEAAGWTIEQRVASAADIRSAYGSKFDDRSVQRKDVESTNTATFDHILHRALEARADEVKFHVRKDSAAITHLIDGRLYPAESMKDPQIAIELLSNAFANLADDNSFERGKESFAHASIDQSCTIMRTINGSRYKLRYSSAPEADGGFDVNLRIQPQDSKGHVKSLEDLDHVPSFVQMMRHATARRRGAIYVCGPVGGGKTTLLYSLLHRKQHERDLYIVTVEDPPEYEQFGITRIPVEKIGYEKLEKKLLRMGVHWVMVGEVRERQMGRMVKVLSETGQKVFTTSHVLSANAIIDRLTGDEIGISRQTLCDTNMIAALAYTCLVPKLCEKCKVAATAEGLGPRITRELARLEVPLASVRVANKDGCSHCKGGRRGRQPVVELIIPDEHYLRLMREGKDGDAKDYWLNTCKTHVTNEDVTGKEMMATALYRVAQGTMDVEDLEREIDLLDTFNPRIRLSEAAK